MSHQHHISVQVSKRRFANNIQHIKAMVAPAKLCVVLKANAYGHGLAQLAPVAIESGTDLLGICTNPEATTVRKVNAEFPLMRLRMALPEEYQESVDDLHIQEQIGNLEAADFLSQAGQIRDNPVPVHLVIDTGMGRSGFFPERVEQMKRVCRLPGLDIIGVMTHFPNADGKDLTNTRQQLKRFNDCVDQLRDTLPNNVMIHTHNSAATVRLTDERQDMVRVGAACFGVRTSQAFNNPPALKPVMQIKTRVAQLRTLPAGKTIGYGSHYTTDRERRIASLPVGFGEGYPRALVNKGIVLIHGQRCPVVGRVSLNVTTVDVTHVSSEISWGDEAVLIGQQSDAEITFEEIAGKFQSVHTELNLMAGFMNQTEWVE